MNKPKNQNSILVLATLGVYLGLVLAGATPQVLAQAATAKQFSVKDEINVNDDLDTNPNGSLPSDALENYLFNVERFLEELKQLRRPSLIRSLQKPFEVITITTLPCIKGYRVGISSSGNTVKSKLIWPAVSKLYNGHNDGYDLGDCVSSQKFDVGATVSRSLMRLDKTTFSIEVGVQKASSTAAHLLCDALSSELWNYDLSDETEIRRQVIASTSFRAENDQVFIVTRLPRAGLDSLLAKTQGSGE